MEVESCVLPMASPAFSSHLAATARHRISVRFVEHFPLQEAGCARERAATRIHA